MKKSDKLKYFKSSLKKWNGIEKNIENQKECDYERIYWKKCGFCKVENWYGHRGISHQCPLNKYVNGVHVCGGCYNTRIGSYGYGALMLATERRFYKALRKCRAFIKQIEKAIEETDKDNKDA